MKKKGFVSCLGLALAAGLAASLLGACSSSTVAATVNGVEIQEDEVTSYIETIRETYQYTDEDSWGTYLASCQLTPDQLRSEVIESFISRELVKQEAEAEGVTVDPNSDEVSASVDQMKTYYESDEAWNEALTAAGLTEEKYREEIATQLSSTKLQEKVTGDVEGSDEDALSYATMYASAYDGAKRSSHILFNAEDEALATEVLEKINSGELDFAEAAKEYSQDTSGAEGGDVGWDKTSSFVEEYTSALNELDKDEVSGLVVSEFGIHIIKCTDVFVAPMEDDGSGTEVVKVTSMDQVPADWREAIDNSVREAAKSEAYQTWLQEKRDAADVVINEMPKGVSYNIDMTKYEEAAAEAAAAATVGTDGVTVETEPSTETEATE